MQLQLYKCVLYINLVVLIPPQSMFKMFPQTSGLENIALFKGGYGDIAITIDEVLLSLDWWLLIITDHMNPLVKI